MPDAVDHRVDPGASPRWMLRLRCAVRGQPTFIFFPHAGGSPLSVRRLMAALPLSAGVLVVNLPRGGDIDGIAPPRRVVQAVDGATKGWLALDQTGDPLRLILVGNSYGALLAYEMAWSLMRAGALIERLVVSGFRSPVLAPVEAPLYRLPSPRLRAELAARFGMAPGEGDWEGTVAEEALRADLEACDTYRHTHAGRLTIPIDVLHMLDDPSVSADDLLTWKAVTTARTRVTRHEIGHFPWATDPDAVARIILQLAQDDGRDDALPVLPQTEVTHDERGWA